MGFPDEHSHVFLFFFPSIMLMSWKLQRSKEREKRSVLFSLSLLLGDLEDGQGKKPSSLQYKTQHLLNSD